MQDLGVAHGLFRRTNGVAGDVGGSQVFYPVGGGPGLERGGNQVEQSLSRGLVPGPASVAVLLGVGVDGVGDADDSGGEINEAGVYAAELYPLSVGALEDAVEGASALRGHAERTDGYRVADGLGGVQERAGHQRGTDSTSPAGRLAPVERGGYAQAGKQRGADIGDGMHDVYRAVAVRGLAGEDARSRGHQIVVGGFVFQRAFGPVSGNGAVN